MANQREIQAQETRQHIIRSVFELMRTNEYNSIRISDIAKNAGVSVGTVYLYFKSKGDIVTNLLIERNELLTANYGQDPKRSVITEYENYLSNYLKLIQEDGFEFSRGMQLAMIEEKIGQHRTNINRQKEYITALVERGVANGELKANGITPERFFEMFIASVNGTIIEWLYCADEQVLIRGMENTKLLLNMLK